MSQTASIKMSTPTRGRRRKAIAAAVALPIAASMMLAGCSAGQLAETSLENSEVPGTSADVGSLHIRDASLSPPTSGHYFTKGSTLYVEMDIANGGAKDVLTAATVGGVEAVIEGPSAASMPRNAESTGAGLAPAITIKQNGITTIGEQNTITADAPEKLYPSEPVDLILTFKNAGEVKMVVPVAVPAAETPKIKSDKIDLHPNEDQGEVD